jgi:hypothetical protein
MKRGRKYLIVGAVTLVVLAWLFDLQLFRYSNENDRWVRTVIDLGCIGGAIQKITQEKRTTPGEWEKIIAEYHLAQAVAPLLDGATPSMILVDRRGQPFVIETHWQNDDLVITIRSTCRDLEAGWFHRRRTAGIEVTIFGDPERRCHVKHLWER